MNLGGYLMKGFRLKYWIIPMVIIIVVLVGFRSGVFSSGKTQLQANVTGVNVQIADAQLMDTIPKLMLNGSIEGKTAATVSAKLAGRIQAVMVQEGQHVKAGEALAKLESVELQNSVRTAQDAVNKAKINYDLAMLDYNRYLTLAAQGAIPQQTLDTAKAKMQVAQADLSTAISGQSDAQQQYAYGVITAPVDGVVANVTATVGQVVSPGAALMIVEDIDQVYAVVNVEQKDLGMVKQGQPAEITVDTYADKVFMGTVDTINPEAGSANRMFRVKVKLDNSSGELKAGMFSKVQLATGDAVQILTIPQAAIIQKQGIYYVFTVANDKVTRHQVEVGATTGDRIEIKSGLQSGDKLAVSNVSQLKDGEVVTIVE